jgi:cell division protein FtsL
MEVERRAQATPLRVEQIARQQLNMRTASPAITQYVNAQGAAIGASLPAVGGGQ